MTQREGPDIISTMSMMKLKDDGLNIFSKITLVKISQRKDWANRGTLPVSTQHGVHTEGRREMRVSLEVRPDVKALCQSWALDFAW